jgi:hypothetical protein
MSYPIHSTEKMNFGKQMQGVLNELITSLIIQVGTVRETYKPDDVWNVKWKDK